MILDIEKNGKKKAQVKKAEAAVEKPSEKPPKKTAAPKDYAVIDFPANGEVLKPAHYAVRIGASQGPVEISIDGSAWKPCRQAGGYFWFDWNKIPLGDHKLAARARTRDGKTVKSKIIQCKVK